jgi:hypothetical protein
MRGFLDDGREGQFPVAFVEPLNADADAASATTSSTTTAAATTKTAAAIAASVAVAGAAELFRCIAEFPGEEEGDLPMQVCQMNETQARPPACCHARLANNLCQHTSKHSSTHTPDTRTRMITLSLQ